MSSVVFSYSQMVQLDITNEKIRSEVSAAQYALCTFMSFVIFVITYQISFTIFSFKLLGVFWNDPKEFGDLAFCSSASVGTSFLVYSSWMVFFGRKFADPEMEPLPWRKDGNFTNKESSSFGTVGAGKSDVGEIDV